MLCFLFTVQIYVSEMTVACSIRLMVVFETTRKKNVSWRTRRGSTSKEPKYMYQVFTFGA